MTSLVLAPLGLRVRWSGQTGQVRSPAGTATSTVSVGIAARRCARAFARVVGIVVGSTGSGGSGGGSLVDLRRFSLLRA